MNIPKQNWIDRFDRLVEHNNYQKGGLSDFDVAVIKDFLITILKEERDRLVGEIEKGMELGQIFPSTTCNQIINLIKK